MFKIPSRAKKLAMKTRAIPLDAQHRQICRDDSGSSHSSGMSSTSSRNESPENARLQLNHEYRQAYSGMPLRKVYRKGDDLEMVHFLQSGWNQVMTEYTISLQQGKPSVVFYKPQSNTLKDFKPFDLEKWYVQRMLQTIDFDVSLAADLCR